MKSCKEFLDEIGLTYLWYAIKDSFISSNDSVTSGNVATWNSGGKSLSDSGFTIGKSVPSDALFTDTKNTAGSTNTTDEIYVVGTKTLGNNPLSYSNESVTITNGELNAKGFNVNPVTSSDDLFVYRQTNNGIEKNKENATITRYVGNSLVWNQLVQNGDFSDGTTGWNTAYSYSTVNVSDGIITIEGDDSTYEHFVNQVLTFVTGHKLYFSTMQYADTIPSYKSDTRLLFAGGVSLKLWASTVNVWEHLSGIVTVGTSTSTAANQVRLYSPKEQTTKYKNIILVDLTLMFGVGKEPSTVEEFERMFPEPYYPYNAGTLINNRTKAIESVGFNLWDEEIEEGNINSSTGNNMAASLAGQFWRSKNYIPVIGGKTYYTKIADGYTVSNANITLYFYDGEKTFIEAVPNKGNTTAQIPDNACYIRIVQYLVNASSVAPQGICINLSDTSRNGTYEPYKKYDLPINLNSFRVKDSNGNIITIEGGLKSAGSVYDEITSDGKYIKRVGDVDLGSLSWNKQSTYNNNFRFRGNCYGKVSTDVGVVSNIVCPKYSAGTPDESYSYPNHIDKICSLNTNNGQLMVVDDSYSDAASFKTAMSGVTLYYELATPEVYDLVEVIPNNYPVDDLGTEARIAPLIDGVPGSPFKGDIDYYRSSDSYLHTVTVNGIPANVENGIAKVNLPDAQLKLKVGESITPIFSSNATEDVRIELEAGDNITLTPDFTAGKVTITADDTTYSDFGASGSSHSSGLVPDPGSTAGTSKYLCEDGSWKEVSTTDNKVSLTATSGNANYEILFSETADNTTRTEGARKNSNLTFNPSSGLMQVTGQVNASQGFFEASDIRKKKVVGDLDLNKAYDLIDKCQTIIYTLKDNDQKQVGLIAQEVKEFFPEIISEDENGMLSLDYSRLTVVILKVLKDLINRVSKLENYGKDN